MSWEVGGIAFPEAAWCVKDRQDKSLGTDYSTPAGSARPELCVTGKALHLSEPEPVGKHPCLEVGIGKHEMFLVTCLVHERHSYLVAYRKQRARVASALRQQSEWPFWSHSWPSISMGYQWQIKNTQKKKLPQNSKKQNLNLPHAEHCAESMQMKWTLP